MLVGRRRHQMAKAASKSVAKFKFPRRPAKWTEQNMFNFVCKCLAIQKKKSMNEDGHCLYRGPGGTRCAAGHCIPNGECKVSFDNVDDDGEWTSSYDIYAVIRAVPSIPNELDELLYSLQFSHDGSDNAKELRESLTEVALNHELKGDAAELIRRWR